MENHMDSILDPFVGDGYSLATLTDAINVFPNMYGRIEELGLFGAGVYLHALVGSHGWPTGLISGAITLFYVVSALLLIPVGGVIGRFGPQPIFALGAVALAAGVAWIGVAGAPWHAYGAFLVMGVGWACLSMTAVAMVRLSASGTTRGSASARSSVTALVSCWNPTPGADTSFATMRSRFLRCSLAVAFATRSFVSAAKPTNTWWGRLAAPRPARMSGVGSSSTVGTPVSFLILPAS